MLPSRQLALATITPLASIFGSGFLIIVPVLSSATGAYAVFAIALVCALAYAVGIVIRHNIAIVEPLHEKGESPVLVVIERVANVALTIAYIVSVALYLRILAAFLLQGLGHDNDFNEQLMTSVIVVVLALVGVWKGFKALEFLEGWSLVLTMIVIATLIGGFIIHDEGVLHSEGLILPAFPHETIWHGAAVVAGTLICVQGFETARYLGDVFDRETRIKACRLSQIIASVIYVGFVALALPMVHLLNGKYDDYSLLTLAGFASALLPLPLIFAAVMSQFSASIADMLAAAGNIEETTARKVTPKLGYPIIAIGTVAIVWVTTTFEIVALASRAFAFYYCLQCIVAMAATSKQTAKLGFGLLAVAMVLIAIFAVPAS